MIYPFKYDYLGLSTDTKPDTSVAADGSTFLEVNTSKLFIKYGDEWYEQNKQEDSDDTEPTEET